MFCTQVIDWNIKYHLHQSANNIKPITSSIPRFFSDYIWVLFSIISKTCVYLKTTNPQRPCLSHKLEIKRYKIFCNTLFLFEIFLIISLKSFISLIFNIQGNQTCFLNENILWNAKHIYQNLSRTEVSKTPTPPPSTTSCQKNRFSPVCLDNWLAQPSGAILKSAWKWQESCRGKGEGESWLRKQELCRKVQTAVVVPAFNVFYKAWVSGRRWNA